MKIAQVSIYDYAYPGGVCTHITKLVENFTRMGHEVKILTPSSRPKQMPENVIVLGTPVPFHSNGSIARVAVSPRLFLTSHIKKILERERFDIIHLHEPMIPPVALAVLRFSQTVNVGTFHAYHGDWSWGYWFWKPVIRRWFEKLHGKIAVSKPAMQFVSRHFPGEYTIIPNGIDVAYFSADAPPIEELHDGKLNILFVGRMERRKGLRHLLGAYGQIKKEFPDTRLIVVGPGDKREYEMLVYANDLKDVVFAGYVSQEELRRYYKTADIFCAPATGKESFGIVLLEAMAASKPIVASRIPGYASVITDGVEGLLTEPKNEDSLAKALSKLIADKSLRQKMGTIGRAKVEEYSWERVSLRVMDYYQSLLSKSPPA